jgi:phosphonate transport system permease protein
MPPRPWLLRWPGLVLALVVGVSYRAAEGDFSSLLAADARQTMAEFAQGFWPPAHSPEFLSAMAMPLLETVCIAFLGMAMALVIAVPLSLAATSPAVLLPAGEQPGLAWRAVYFTARFVLNVMRAIPELIWALIFVRALGIGPAPGVLAIAVAYSGVLGKVFAEIFESTPRAPSQGLMLMGATPLRSFFFGILPGAGPGIVSYTLYRLDCALRASAVLGLVGAGGLGQQIDLSIRMFQYDEVATILLILLVLVAALDRGSELARRWLHRSNGLLPHGMRGLWLRIGGGAALAVLLWGAARVLSFSPETLVSREATGSMAAFISAMYPPDINRAFLTEIGVGVWETLALSVLGTAIAAVMALVLTYFAAYRLHGVSSDADDGREPAVLRIARVAMGWGARLLLNVGRTLPEMLFALLFIFALGLGPFPGALALGLHTAGVLGRLYAEVLEDVALGPYFAVKGSGARTLPAVLFAVLPQAFPQLVAFTLYRWEVNIRASAVLGVVGAGGLGKQLHISLSLFQEHRTLTLLLVIFALVSAVDLFSGWLRQRVIAPSSAARGAGTARLEVAVLPEMRGAAS